MADVVYASTVARTVDAYRSALREENYEIVSATDSTLSALSTDERFPSDAQVSVRSVGDGAVLAETVSRYPGSTQRHRNHSYTIASQATAELREAGVEGRFAPQAVYPAAARACDFPDEYGPDELEAGELELPRIQGGLRALQARVAYPSSARDAGIEGLVMVQFVVDASGQVSCAEVHGGLPGGLNREALAAIAGTSFEPATFRGEPVPFTMNMPLSFILPD